MSLYHGSQNDLVSPMFGCGSPFHDFGAGFYLTDDVALAKEWSVYKPRSNNGWVHTFDLDVEELSGDIIDAISPEWLRTAYEGLHDLDMKLVVDKVAHEVGDKHVE